MDCALAGDCIKGRCSCDAGWKDPEDGGTPCSAFDLLPVDQEKPGYKNESWPSWGGHPVFWSTKVGGDDQWHLFTPQARSRPLTCTTARGLYPWHHSACGSKLAHVAHISPGWPGQLAQQ